MIKFIVPGEPQGKARPRIVRQGGFVRNISPEKTVNYEALVKMSCQNASKEYYQEGPVKVIVYAYYSIPKAASKKQQALMRTHQIRPTKKPDADNVAKIICDACNSIAYKDDTQVVDLLVKKFYTDNEPRVEVEIELLKGGEN